ncbi:AAA family ATPase [Shewanella decolorationis]|uniref:AAA family ATPase n=1 Tax=Shewanella decolorationis TaxID=256839 RepID=UPI001056FE5C|nr:AAA family ATPase [Shewanella decolorationis]
MLQDFSVKGFRNFKDWYSFSFKTKKNYEFNCENINDNIIINSIVYGKNGCGKSNLGVALLDVTCHINDIPVMLSLNINYLSGHLERKDLAEFKYVFKFDDDIIEYRYGKESVTSTVYEQLLINDIAVISLDRRISDQIFVDLKGAETLNKNLSDSNISAVKYIKSNTVLDLSDKNALAFKKFIDFVSGMLFFRTLTQSADYYGQRLDGNRLSKAIIDSGKLLDFEKFLNDAGVECKLGISGQETEEKIVFKYEKSNLDFVIAASTGTMSLGIFYYWWLKLESGKVTFAYIDEFDAYYHHILSRLVVKKLIDVKCQKVLTTHNSSIISNDLLRPDCYFILEDRQYPLYEMVDKDLRKAHNLEKIYKGLQYDPKE